MLDGMFVELGGCVNRTLPVCPARASREREAGALDGCGGGEDEGGSFGSIVGKAARIVAP
jgi:hypothetical protein